MSCYSDKGTLWKFHIVVDVGYAVGTNLNSCVNNASYMLTNMVIHYSSNTFGQFLSLFLAMEICYNRIPHYCVAV